MKISMKDHKNYTELFYIESGDIFRPVNSQTVYLHLASDITDDIWNECDSRLINYFENPQNHEIGGDMKALRPCVDMETGELIFFHEDLRVVKLNYLLEVEE